MPKLTLISQYFYPEMISTGQILTELLEALSDRGISSSVICAQPTYYGKSKVAGFMIHRNIAISRTANTQYDKNVLKGKVCNAASFFLAALVKAFAQKAPDLFLLVTNPSFLGAMGPILKVLKKRPFVLIIHDLYPDIAIKTGYLKKGTPIDVLWQKMNRWIYRSAHFIVVLGRDMQELVRRQMPSIHRSKVVYIPNWADPQLIQPMPFEKNRLIQQLGLQNKFVVQYSGNMGLTHDMETIIEAAIELREDHNIHFLLIGGGGKLPEIKATAARYRLHNMTFLPYQPRENLKHSLGAAHVGLVSLAKNTRGLSVPSKIYGIMASGRPTVAIVPARSEIAETVHGFRCGIVTPPGDASALVSAIIFLRADKSERTAMGQRAYTAFELSYTLRHGAQRYLDLIQQTMRGAS